MARNNRNRLAKPHNVQVSQLAGTNSLPSLPHITARLLELLDHPDVSVSEVAEIVRLDPALSLNVMRLAQGPAAQGVLDVADAAQIVGKDTLAHLVRWSSALDVFDTYSFCSPGDLTKFWVHSVKCALLAEQIGRELDLHNSRTAFLAGLLHDIGKLLLLTYYPTKYKLNFERGSEATPREHNGDELVGDNHASVGAELVRRWRHHSLLADSIYYHHHPADAVAQAFPLVKAVYAANVLAKDDSPGEMSFARSEVSILGLDGSRLRRAVDAALCSFDETTSALGIDLSSSTKDSSKPAPSHTDAHAAVAGHVRDTSLLATLSYGLLIAEQTDEVLRLVEETLHGHFDIDRVMFFLVESGGKALKGHGRCCTDLGELSLPLSYEKCTPVLALTERRAIDCFVSEGESDASIIDEQIIRLLGKEGILCLPMLADEKVIGSIVLGIESSDRAPLTGQKQFLDLLAQYAARALARCKPTVQTKDAQQHDAVKSVITLTRRAVHEVNNPLGIINNYLTVLARKLAEQDIAHDEIRIIGEEITRIRDILRALVESSKKAAMTLEPVDLNALLRDLLRLMSDDLSLHNGIQVHTQLSESLPLALTDKDALKQAVINLLKNSAEALTDGGNIYVQTEYAPQDERGRSNEVEAIENGAGKARLIIRDDGPGIPESLRSRLFQPFVTSKDQHEGLGLSIAHGLIQQLSGTITCDPVADSGTQFTICLPVIRS